MWGLPTRNARLMQSLMKGRKMGLCIKGDEVFSSHFSLITVIIRTPSVAAHCVCFLTRDAFTSPGAAYVMRFKLPHRH